MPRFLIMYWQETAPAQNITVLAMKRPILLSVKNRQGLSAGKPDAFYAADSCGKLKLISEKNIFSPAFMQKLFDINCPAAASPAVR